MRIPNVSSTTYSSREEPVSSYRVLNKKALEMRTQELANNTLHLHCDSGCSDGDSGCVGDKYTQD